MSSIIQLHYNIDEITKLNANFNIIFGEKSNGKSEKRKYVKKVLELYKLFG